MAMDALVVKNQKWFMRPVLLHLMQLPSLSDLKLDWIKKFPVFDLIHSACLKHLTIQDTNILRMTISVLQ